MSKAWMAFGVGLIGMAIALVRGQTGATNYSPGLAVGTRAPAFRLKGQDGHEHALADYLKHGIVALVFFRSADW